MWSSETERSTVRSSALRGLAFHSCQWRPSHCRCVRAVSSRLWRRGTSLSWTVAASSVPRHFEQSGLRRDASTRSVVSVLRNARPTRTPGFPSRGWRCRARRCMPQCSLRGQAAWSRQALRCEARPDVSAPEGIEEDSRLEPGGLDREERDDSARRLRPETTPRERDLMRAAPLPFTSGLSAGSCPPRPLLAWSSPAAIACLAIVVATGWYRSPILTEDRTWYDEQVVLLHAAAIPVLSPSRLSLGAMALQFVRLQQTCLRCCPTTIFTRRVFPLLVNATPPNRDPIRTLRFALWCGARARRHRLPSRPRGRWGASRNAGCIARCRLAALDPRQSADQVDRYCAAPGHGCDRSADRLPRSPAPVVGLGLRGRHSSCTPHPLFLRLDGTGPCAVCGSGRPSWLQTVRSLPARDRRAARRGT